MKKLLILACILLPFIGSSQIVYTNANDTVLFSMNDLTGSVYTASHDFDIDNDGQRDFQFTIKKSGLTNLFSNISISKDATYNNQVKTVITGYPLTSNPNTDQMIDMEGTMVCPDYRIPSPYLNEPIGTSGWLGGTAIEWDQLDLHNGDISLYIGVEFQRIHPISGNLDTHYGYIHIGLGANNALVLHSYAWNPVPNDCIMANDYYLPNSGIICTQNVTVYDTTNITVFDTTVITVNDTTFFTIPVWDTIIQTVFDTTFIQSNDTIFWNDTLTVNDTIIFNDTLITNINLGTYLDTLTITIIDTNWINLGTYLDTLVINVLDTIIFNDTLTTNIYDTLNLYVLDTITTTVWDTVGCGGTDPIVDPNPVVDNTSTYLIIDYQSNYNFNIVDFDFESQYFITNMLGERLEEVFDDHVYVSHLANGIYILSRISPDGRGKSVKFRKL